MYIESDHFLTKFIKMNKNRFPLVLAFLICAISSSILAQETCLQNAWNAYNSSDYTNAIKYADQCIDDFGRKATEIQKECEQKGIPKPPTGATSDPEKNKIFVRGLLNDVATACFVKGRSAESLYKKNKAKNKAYKATAEEAYNLTCKYSYGRYWDPKGWFWSPCDEAKLRLPID
ncbi:MAG: hypothetical protein DYG98_11330 [Haliscomenobacteraceae bacterium CHB4]|nr:hypothetical protein [Haliscomenobacteraceae bacterium CHB4]